MMAANYWVSSGKARMDNVKIDGSLVEVTFLNGRVYKIEESDDADGMCSTYCKVDPHKYQMLHKEWIISELVAMHIWDILGGYKANDFYKLHIVTWTKLLKPSDQNRVQKVVDRVSKYKILPHGRNISMFNLDK